MRRLVRNLAIAGLLGLAFMVLSLGYSQRVFYSTSTGGGVSSNNDYTNMGFPLPWATNCYVGCCDSSCSVMASSYPTHLNGLNTVADYVLWFAVAFMIVLAVDYALASRQRAKQ